MTLKRLPSSRTRLTLVALLGAGLVAGVACGLGASNSRTTLLGLAGQRAQPGVTGSDALAGKAADRSAAGQGGAAQAEPARQRSEAAGAPAPAERAAASDAARGAPAGSAAGAAPPQPLQQPLPPLPPISRMIVKTGSLTLQVGDLFDAVQRVSGVVASVPGAYIAASTTSYRSDTSPAVAGGVQPGVAEPGPGVTRPLPAPSQSATITVKVPADTFDDVLQRLRGLGTPLLENIGTQEVTEEFVDLEAQVRNLEATEQQYMRFLERAQRLEDILPLQQRLTEVRNQIERLKGRLNLLQRRADLSTISVTLVLPASKADQTGPEPRVVRTLRDAFSHLGVLLQGALDVAIYLGVYALPLLPFVALYLWWRRGRRSPAPGAGGAM